MEQWTFEYRPYTYPDSNRPWTMSTRLDDGARAMERAAARATEWMIANALNGVIVEVRLAVVKQETTRHA